jgi:uridine kinase
LAPAIHHPLPKRRPSVLAVHDLDVRSNSAREVVDLTSLAEEVRRVSRRPRLVAVDGRAGAGKSHFARSLIPLCGDVVLVRVDDFLWWGDIEGWWERLHREALEPLLDGRPAQFRVRDWKQDPLGRDVGDRAVLEPAETVVVEGVGSSRRDVAERIDQAYWVEARPETRLRRGLRRDGEVRRRNWLEWMDLEDTFFAADGAPSRADLVIDGEPTVPHDPAREVVRIAR